MTEPGVPSRGGFSGWMKARMPVNLDGLYQLTNEPVPGHMRRWWFALGGTAAYFFLLQIATGILLMFFYVPEPGRAYSSVAAVTHEIPFGWWVRSLHKWGASGMIVVVCLHTLRVFFTDAYRKPRELTWIAGCLILFTTLGAGLSGYSLVYEQLSYWGATVASNLIGALPFVGRFMARLVRGGDDVGPATLTRFFVVHVAILPAMIGLLVVAHVALVRIHGITPLAFRADKGEPRVFPFIPDHLLTELGISLVMMTLLNVVAVLAPAGLGDRADPEVTPEHIRPEWYFYVSFRWLKLTSLETGVLGPIIAAGLMLAWPVADAGLRRLSPRRDLSTVFGIAAVLVVVTFTVWEAVLP